jgi:DNA-binding transcriptional MerR regulator
MNSAFEEVFGGEALQIPMLTSREVTETLGIKMPRLERFLENYELEPAQRGQGQGTQRLFSLDNVRRLAIAKWLLADGFQPRLVAKIIEDLKDRQFVEYDNAGRELSLSLVLRRDPELKKRKAEIVSTRSGKAAPMKEALKNAYYSLDLDPLIAEVDERVREVLLRRGKGR